MKAIQTTLKVGPDGQASLQAPVDLAPGEHQAVVIDERPAQPKPRKPLKIPTIDAAPVPADFTFRREDLYGDDGR